MGSKFSAPESGEYHLDHPRGWLVVLGVEFTQLATFGLIGSFPVFHHLMLQDSGLGHPTKSELALVNAITGSVGIWLGWIWGYVGDQFGPRPLLMISTTLIACSMVMPALFAQSYIGLIFLYALPMTTATGIANSPLAATVGAWFDKYLSTALGVLQIGGGLGTLSVPVVAGAIAEATGSWRTSFFILSSYSLLGLLSILFITPRRPVAETRVQLDPALLESKGRAYALVVQIIRDMKGALKVCFSKNFALLFVSGFSGGYSFFTVIYVTILIALDFGRAGTPYSDLEKVSLTKASSVFVPFGIGQTIGCVAWGLIGLKLSTKYAQALGLAFTAFSSIFLGEASTFVGLLVWMTCCGFFTGGNWVLFPALVVECFPCGTHLGLVMGLGYTAIGMGATLGPLLSTVITVAPALGNGSYELALNMSAVICIIGAICAVMLPSHSNNTVPTSSSPEDQGCIHGGNEGKSLLDNETRVEINNCPPSASEPSATQS